MPGDTPAVPFVIPSAPRRPRPRSTDIGRVDPSLYANFDQDEVYEVSEDHIGRLWFRVRFLPGESRLEVCVLKARNLHSRARRFSGSACSTFVEVALLPLAGRQASTRVKKSNSDPDFGETFAFDVDRQLLKKCILHFAVTDTWPEGRQRTIGSACFTMRELGDANADSGHPVAMWRDLSHKPTSVILPTGLVHLAITYFDTLERLVVTVAELHHAGACAGRELQVLLRMRDGTGGSEQKQSSPQSCGQDGAGVRVNESFQFRVARDRHRDLLLTVSLQAFARAPRGRAGDASSGTTVGAAVLAAAAADEAGELLRRALEAGSSNSPAAAWLPLVQLPDA